ncbi:hypothetical protein Gohar_003408 [Gossypium harknessii]|uniref:Uncharacterized protein n=1 Tax=Gossypium harknessii TaxID=34285 RepID=A0A7J9HNW4_9ROSI|nr:hypothetical protein [Gossypium harknessii]
MEIKMEKLHTLVSSSTNYTSYFHSEVQIFCYDKLRDITWLILAPNLRTLSVSVEIEEHILGCSTLPMF